MLRFLNFIPLEIRPSLTSVVITTMDVETTLKIFSLVLSMSFLIWKWRQDIINSKKNKDE